eukprot:3492157-Rhodomonas_salina.1
MASFGSRKQSLSATAPEVLTPDDKHGNGAVSTPSQPRSPVGGALVDVQAVGLDSDKPSEDSRKSAQRYSILTEVLAQKRIEVEQLRASFRKKGSPSVSYDDPDFAMQNSKKGSPSVSYGLHEPAMQSSKKAFPSVSYDLHEPAMQSSKKAFPSVSYDMNQPAIQSSKKGSPSVSYDVRDPVTQNKHKPKEKSLSPPSTSFRIGSQSPVKMASASPAPRHPSISPALRLGDSSVADKSRTSLDREFSPKSTDSYTAQRLRDKLRDMEKVLVKTQSDLIKEREQGWALKAQLAMEMEGRMKVAEVDLKKSKDELEGRYREEQERAQETRVALDQEKRKTIALEAQM